VTEFTRSVHSLHYYDSVLVIEKRPLSPPYDRMTGQRVFADPELAGGLVRRASGRLKREIRRLSRGLKG
jgi:hypothetical protein